ncbi:TlpA disulfide reductase family protein [Kribbella sp. NPDC023972]|uniref:TlpA family protein disulfide reductase n=1 Tax=Kribbella sp. NPDC023972 TaxID=3154795 RepID=UPI0034077DAC
MNFKLGLRTTRCLIAGLVAVAGLAGCGPEQADGTQPQATSSRSAVAGADKLTACPSTPSRPPVSNGLPDVSLPCLGNGPDIRLADLRGPLLVNVWAQWCPPCRAEAPYLAELQKKAGGKVQLLGIDYDDPRAELAVKFAIEHELTYPHLVDADKVLHQPFKIGGPPVTAFVDLDGAVTYVHHGPFKSQQQLDQLVQDKLGVTP